MMGDTQKIILAAIILVLLALMPGIITGWGLAHSMVAMFVIGIGGAILENR
jgi:hypothetical protein